MGRAPTWSSREGPRQPSFHTSNAQLGMLVLLTSLGVLFLASLVAFTITRLNNRVWLAPGMPSLPQGLWLSSGCLVLLSVALETTRSRVRHNRLAAAGRALSVAWLAALGFMACQVACWLNMQGQLLQHTTLYPFTYFFLSGLHAVHVLAGFVPLWVVSVRLRSHEYSSSRYEGLSLCVQYWHFLGVVWLVLFAALELASHTAHS